MNVSPPSLPPSSRTHTSHTPPSRAFPSIGGVPFHLAAFAAFFALFLGIGSGYGVWLHHQETQRVISSLASTSALTENALLRELDSVLYRAQFAAKQLAKQDRSDPAVASLFVDLDSDRSATTDLLSSSFFDWLSPDLELRVSSGYGEIPSSFSRSHFSYASDSLTQPARFLWHHLSSHPLHLREAILPATIGITDANGGVAGVLSVGVPWNTLVSSINRTISHPYLYYVLLAADGSVIGSNQLTMDSSVSATSPFPVSIPSDSAQMLPNPISFDGGTLLYYRPLPAYGFSLLVGYTDSLSRTVWRDAVWPRLSEFALIALLLGLGLSLWTMQRMRTLYVLAASAQLIAQGALPHRLPHSRIHEFSRISYQLLQIMRRLRRDSTAQHELLHESIFLEEMLARSHEAAHNSFYQIACRITYSGRAPSKTTARLFD